MEIVWLGHSCFRIRGREATIVTDPCPPTSGYAIGRPTGDIVTISNSHPNHSYLKAIPGNPVAIDSPGEYEVHGAFITGVRTFHDSQKGGERGANVAFVIEMEDMRVCHLGDLGHTPTAEQAEELVGADVLFVPVGGGTTIDGPKAAEIAALLEARLVVPMHYRTEATKDNLEPPERFFKEMGVAAVEPQTKLSLNRSSIPGETQVVVMDYRR